MVENRTSSKLNDKTIFFILLSLETIDNSKRVLDLRKWHSKKFLSYTYVRRYMRVWYLIIKNSTNY